MAPVTSACACRGSKASREPRHLPRGRRGQGCLMEALAWECRGAYQDWGTHRTGRGAIRLAPLGWKSEVGTKRRETSRPLYGSSPDHCGSGCSRVVVRLPGVVTKCCRPEISRARAAGAGDEGARLVPRPGCGRRWPGLRVSVRGLCPCVCPVPPLTTSPASCKARGRLSPLVFLHIKNQVFRVHEP